MDVPPKLLFALLNATFKQHFESATQYTPAFLHEQLFADASPPVELATVERLVVLCARVLTRLAYDAASSDDAATVLERSPLAPAQRAVVVKFWATNRDKALEAVRRRARFNRSLVGFEWRVDVQTKRMSGVAPNEPTGIVEWTLSPPPSSSPSSSAASASSASSLSTVTFEMSKGEVELFAAKLERIRRQLAAAGTVAPSAPTKRGAVPKTPATASK